LKKYNLLTQILFCETLIDPKYCGDIFDLGHLEAGGFLQGGSLTLILAQPGWKTDNCLKTK